MAKTVNDTESLVVSVRMPAALRDRAKLAASGAGVSLSRFIEMSMESVTPGGGDPLEAAAADATAVALAVAKAVGSIDGADASTTGLVARSRAIAALAQVARKAVADAIPMEEGGVVSSYNSARMGLLHKLLSGADGLDPDPDMYERVRAALPEAEMLPVGGFTIGGVMSALGPTYGIAALKNERALIVFGADMIFLAAAKV